MSDPTPIRAHPAGVDFQVHFCLNCERDGGFMEGADLEGCLIAAMGVALEPGDEHFPDEFKRDEDGRWSCTAFLPRGSQIPTDAELEEAGQLNVLEAGP